MTNVFLLIVLIKYKANINHFNNNGNNALLEYFKNVIIDNILFVTSFKNKQDIIIT
jgi:hypothetical protein